MKTRKLYQIFLVLGFLLIIYVPYCSCEETSLTPQVFIAHAGGAVNNKTYTNSLEALNMNYEKGFRFFEIDFSWTADGKLVAIHDWQNAFRQMFYVPQDIDDIPTNERFLQLRTKTGLTQLSFAQVLKWVQEKGDAFIITDVKKNNLKALRLIKTDYREHIKFIIPQVYSYQEFSEAEKLGYSNIILTIYRMKTNAEELLYFAEIHSPFAITMPWEIAQSGIAYYLNKKDTRVYAHTVNDINLFNSLKDIGVYGIYTDYIVPE